MNLANGQDPALPTLLEYLTLRDGPRKKNAILSRNILCPEYA